MALEQLHDALTQQQQPQQLTPDQQAKRERKAEQARINGRKSKGPISATGKKNSSKNAIRHGLTANEHTLLTTEFPAEYHEVYTAFLQALRPACKAETRFVEKLANLDWRLERLVMMETCVLNMGADLGIADIAARFERIDGIGIIVEAWKESCSASHCLDLLRRYMATLQSQINATLKNFRDLEKHRLARTRGGTDLDVEWGPPYEVPALETLLPSQAATVTEPPKHSEPSSSNNVSDLAPRTETGTQPPRPSVLDLIRNPNRAEPRELTLPDGPTQLGI
jgi:hypothetical protein